MAADGSIKIDTKIDSSSLPRQLKSMENAVKSSTSYMGDAFAKLRDVMQGPIAAIGMTKSALNSLWGATIANAAVLEDFIAAFTPLTGSAESARRMIAALNKEAANTPFELKDIASVAKQLLPVLGNDVKAVTETFRMLGDTAGGNAEKLDSIARGYVKVMNTGKVSMEALNMISDAGVPIQRELAKSMGITVQQMYDLSSQGKITSEELTKTFKKMTTEGGLFYNGMIVASETLNGKLSTLSDNLKQAGGAIGKEMLPAVKLLVDGANTIVGAFATWAGKNDNLKKTFIAMVSAISGPVGNILIPIIAKVRDTLGSWSLVFLSVQKIALTVVKATLDYISTFANTFVTVINGMIGAYNKIVGLVGGKPIELFKNVDISQASGITESVDNITKQIEKERRELANLALQSDKTTYTQKTGNEKAQQSQEETTEAVKDTEKAEKTLNTELKKTSSIFDDIKRGFDKAFSDFVTDIKADAADWSDTFKSMGSAVKNGIGKSFQQVGEMIVNGGGFKEFGKIALQSLADILKALGDQLAAMAVVKFLAGDMAGALAAGAGSAAALVASGIAGALASAANAADQLAQNTAAAVVSLSDILRGGKSSYEDYLGQKQVEDFSKSLTDLKTKQEAQQKALAYWREEQRKAYADVAANIAQFGNTIQEKMTDSMVAGFSNAVTVTQKEIDALEEVYTVVYKNNKVTATSSEILEDWSNKLKETIIAFGKESIEVKAVNENYQKLLNDALYPTEAALEDANATLKTNSTLWTDAAKATYAFESSLSAIREKAASFYESFSNIGADIADTLVDSLVDGLDETSFLDAMKEYIMKMVVQAAVYTTELTDKIAKIGQRIATAIASGMTGDALAGIKNDLSSLFQEASGKASAVMGIVNSAFSGNAGVNSIANGLGGSLAPAVATTGGQTININLTSQNVTQLDGRTIAVSVAENIDTVLAAM